MHFSISLFLLKNLTAFKNFLTKQEMSAPLLNDDLSESATPTEGSTDRVSSIENESFLDLFSYMNLNCSDDDDESNLSLTPTVYNRLNAIFFQTVG